MQSLIFIWNCIFIFNLLERIASQMIQDNYRTTFINGKKYILPAGMQQQILSRFPSAKGLSPQTNSFYGSSLSNTHLNALPLNYQGTKFNNQFSTQAGNLLSSSNTIQTTNIIPSANSIPNLSNTMQLGNLIPTSNMQLNKLGAKSVFNNQAQVSKLSQTVVTNEQLHNNAKIELERMKIANALMPIINFNPNKYSPNKPPMEKIDYNKYNFQNFGNNKKNINFPISASSTIKKKKIKAKNHIRSTGGVITTNKIKKANLQRKFTQPMYSPIEQPDLVPSEKSVEKGIIIDKLPFNLVGTKRNKNTTENKKMTVIPILESTVNKDTKSTKQPNVPPKDTIVEIKPQTTQTAKTKTIKIAIPYTENPAKLWSSLSSVAPKITIKASSDENIKTAEKKKKVSAKKKKTKAESKKVQNIMPSNSVASSIPNTRHHSNISSTENKIASMLRCQDPVTRELIPQATSCKNTRSDRICSYLFTPVDKKAGKRDVKCNLQGKVKC